MRYRVGPLHATWSRDENADGVLLGYSNFVACPLPTASAYAALVGSGVVTANITLSVHHGISSAVVEVPWTGSVGDNSVTTTMDSGAHQPAPTRPPPRPTSPQPHLSQPTPFRHGCRCWGGPVKRDLGASDDAP